MWICVCLHIPRCYSQPNNGWAALNERCWANKRRTEKASQRCRNRRVDEAAGIQQSLVYLRFSLVSAAFKHSTCHQTAYSFLSIIKRTFELHVQQSQTSFSLIQADAKNLLIAFEMSRNRPDRHSGGKFKSQSWLKFSLNWPPLQNSGFSRLHVPTEHENAKLTAVGPPNFVGAMENLH